jgi:hypothetical protein
MSGEAELIHAKPFLATASPDGQFSCGDGKCHQRNPA